MYKVTIENKVIQTDENMSVDELVKKNFNNIKPVAAMLNGALVDMSEIINKDSLIELIDSSDEKGLEIIRHTCAHVFGHAIKQLYPNTKMVIGPTIDNGFYYDIDAKESISEKDLSAIESLMKKLAKKNYKIIREVVTKEKAQSVFKERKEDYKLKLIEDIPV